VGYPVKWMVDKTAFRHICSNWKLFKEYKKMGDREGVFMRNASTTKILGRGKISLKVTSRKILSLSNVLHVPEMHRN